jgi:phenylacetic acid degradation operon negative regulatory protein
VTQAFLLSLPELYRFAARRVNLPVRRNRRERGDAATLLARLVAEAPPRAKSLIVTVFGDTVAPHGGTVWLGSLITALAPFGVSERLVRTAALRLTRDDWLTARQVGRRSDYSLTEAGRRRIEDAQRRIYASGPPVWDGRWTLVLLALPSIAPREREELRRALAWEGFGTLAPGVMMHPVAGDTAFLHALEDHPAGGRAIVLDAATADLPGAKLDDLFAAAWDLAGLAAEYERFTERFAPLASLLADARPELQFRARTFAVHEFRRILLRDPLLPAALLPQGWPGAAAREVLRSLYAETANGTAAYVAETFQTAKGALPEPAPGYAERFGQTSNHL